MSKLWICRGRFCSRYTNASSCLKQLPGNPIDAFELEKKPFEV